MEDITILGAGSFGTGLAIALANNGHKLNLYIRAPDILNIIKSDRMNQTYLPGYSLNENVNLMDDMSKAVKGTKYLFLVLPAHSVEEILTKLKNENSIDSKTIIVLTSKGIVDGIALTEVKQKILPENKICGLYGITFAELIAGGGGFSSMCIASEHEDVANDIANFFIDKQNVNHFRIYISKDLKGAEFGGAMKNVYAIAMGLFDGYLEFLQKELTLKGSTGTKIILSRNSLLNLCMMEFFELGLAYGAKSYTLLGPSGIGDIVACASDTSNNASRNYQYGRWKALLEFKKVLLPINEQIRYQYLRAPSLHEGYDTVKSAKKLVDKYNIQAPIINAVYKILYENGKIQDTVSSLIDNVSRKVESEEESNFFEQVYKSNN